MQYWMTAEKTDKTRVFSFLIWIAGLVFTAGIAWAKIASISSLAVKVEDQDKKIVVLESKMDYVVHGVDRILNRLDRR